MNFALGARRAGSTRCVTCAVLTPPGGKANRNKQQQQQQRKKTASALAFLSQNTEEEEGGPSELDRLGLYGRQPSALEQASSLTAAHRALLSSEDEYDVDSESAPGLWEKLSGKHNGDNRYIM